MHLVSFHRPDAGMVGGRANPGMLQLIGIGLGIFAAGGIEQTQPRDRIR
jgi:hypothetical protein